MTKYKYMCKKINWKTKIFYIDNPNRDLVKCACKLFEKVFSLVSSEEERNSVSPQIKVIPTFYRRFSSVYLLEDQARSYIAKKFFVSSIEQNVSNLCKGPKAIRSFNTALDLTTIDVSVPKPLFVLVYWDRPLKKESIYVTPKFNGPSLESFIVNNHGNSRDKVVKTLLNLFTSLGVLYRNYFMQTDPNLNNFMIDLNNYQITFIDVNSIRYKPKLTEGQILRNLAILNSHFYHFLVRNHLVHLYSQDRILFYLKKLYNTYPLSIDLSNALNILFIKTVNHLVCQGQRDLITEGSFLANFL